MDFDQPTAADVSRERQLTISLLEKSRSIVAKRARDRERDAQHMLKVRETLRLSERALRCAW